MNNLKYDKSKQNELQMQIYHLSQISDKARFTQLKENFSFKENYRRNLTTIKTFLILYYIFIILLILMCNISKI